MVIISEVPGGSSGGDPNKNPQEVEKNLRGELQQRPQLPDDVIRSILARLPRRQYTELTVVSKAFCQLIWSQDFSQTRSFLGFTEPFLYAQIGFPPFFLPTWFILHRRNTLLQFTILTSLPPMFPGSVTVTIGNKMYVMGGYIGFFQPVSAVYVIDCRFHTWRFLPCMQRPRIRAAAGVIDGKIYVIGGCKKRNYDWIEVFDVEQERWDFVPTQCPSNASTWGDFATYVVMPEKIFILDNWCCLAYEPRQGIWHVWGFASELRNMWHPSCCVIEDMLYTINFRCSYPRVMVYYPNESVWEAVRGLNHILEPVLCEGWSAMANFGGKLVIFGYQSSWVNDIWYIQNALETRQGGKIWGRFESCTKVFRVVNFPSIDCCRTVTV